LSDTTIPGEYPDTGSAQAGLLAPRRHAELLTYRLHFVAKAAGQRTADLFQRSFAVSRRQLRVLSLLADGVARSPSELAELISVDRGRMSRTLDELEQRGFVSRRSVAGDARRQLLTLTPAGERLYSHLFGEVRKLNSELLAAIEPGDLPALERVLAVLERQLGIDRPAGASSSLGSIGEDR
jgi:DNA-binding MarR family transcriptional regulator